MSRQHIVDLCDRGLLPFTDRSLRGRELRQNNPFAGLLSKDEREQILEAWRRQHTAAS